MIFVLGYNALAPAFASWREEGLLARSVPGAWLLEYGVQRVSALYYFGNVDHHLFTRAMAQQQRRSSSDEEAPAAPAEAGLALFRGAEPVRRRFGTVLLANRAAQRALAEQAEGSSR